MADANAAPPLENDAQGTAAVYYVTDAPPPNEVSADLSLDGWINAMQSNQINNINNNNSGGRWWHCCSIDGFAWADESTSASKLGGTRDVPGSRVRKNSR